MPESKDPTLLVPQLQHQGILLQHQGILSSHPESTSFAFVPFVSAPPSCPLVVMFVALIPLPEPAFPLKKTPDFVL